MNNKKRKQLDTAIEYLNRANDIVSSVSLSEADCMDNIPENLHGSERYEQMERGVDALESASEKIEDAIASICDAQD